MDDIEEDSGYYYAPEIRGRLWVIPAVHYGTEIAIWIGGDPEGLSSLGEKLIWLADVDQEAVHTPMGERAHMHLEPKRNFGYSGELSAGSCRVELCRADASGTGEIYPHLLASERDLVEFTADVTPPEEWLAHAHASLDLARSSRTGSKATRQLVPALAGQAAFCALMSALRTLGITIPERVNYNTELTFFVPEDLSIPFPVHEIDDLLLGEMPRPGGSWQQPADVEEIDLALDRAEMMVEWAAGLRSSRSSPR